MTATLSDEAVTAEPPCAEEDLYPYMLDEQEAERSELTGGFSGEIVVHQDGICVLALDIPESVDHWVVKGILPSVKTNDVVCATLICGQKVVLELQEWTQDPEIAAGVWFDKLIGVVSSLDKSTLKRLKKADKMESKILEAISYDAQSSTFGSFEY